MHARSESLVTAGVPHRVGLYLACVQFLFALTWTVYVIFLPALAAQAGISRQAVVYILMLDQLIFAAADLAMGIAADRVSRTLGRLGYVVLGLTLASCLAFLLLPFIAPHGPAWLFLLLTALWAASSSALRGPPFVLIGKHAAEPAIPWLSALSLFGLGVAGAAGPYLTIVLREVDPRLPFALSSLALAAATAGIVAAERALTRRGAPQPQVIKPAARKPGAAVGAFAIAALLLGLGFQIHFSLNSAPLYLRVAAPADLPYLMPVFWIGFNILMLPASLATRRYGGPAVTAAGAAVAAVAALAGSMVRDLDALLVLQFIAGGGWGCVLMSAMSAALAMGRTGREGRMTGAFFSLLALAAFARIAVLAAGLNKDPLYAAFFEWAPAALWGLAGIILVVLIARQPRAVGAAA